MMVVYDMFFHCNTDSEDCDFALTDYLCALSGNNQIIFETLNISGTGHVRVARVTTPYEDSLDKKYDDTYTKEASERLSAYLTEQSAYSMSEMISHIGMIVQQGKMRTAMCCVFTLI